MLSALKKDQRAFGNLLAAYSMRRAAFNLPPSEAKLRLLNKLAETIHSLEDRCDKRIRNEELGITN